MILLFIAGVLLTAAAVFAIFKIQKKFKSAAVSAALTLLCAFIIALGLEISVFNINYYTSHNYTGTDLSTQLENLENGVCSVPSRSTLEFTVNEEIKNVRITLDDDNSTVKVHLYLTDDANKNYFSSPERALYPAVDASQYINVHTSGKTEKLGIHVDSSRDFVNIKSISVNTPRTFNFSYIRILMTAGIIVLLYIFSPSSVIYKRKLNERADLTRSLVPAFLCLELAVIILLGSINPAFLGVDIDTNGIYFYRLSMTNHNQYDELAEAILESGKFYIDNDDVPQSLIDMENPYDTTERTHVSQLTGDTYRWDVAFFNGHYYVYFGIVPLLIMYLPFRALFKEPFPSAVGVMIFAAVFAAGVFMLLKHIAEKRFKNISVGSFLLVSLGAINFGGMIFLVKRPDFYSVPIMCACAFTVWGIFCWLKALDGAKKRRLLLFLGALFMALSVGCRPQSVIVSAVALPLFIPEYITSGKIKKKSGIAEIATLAVPYVAVAAVIMAYNYMRFGSPFDFGSAYNLTTNDVTHRGFEPARTGLGIFTYLFQPPKFTAVFPFLEKAGIATNYAGKTIYENCFGGLITTIPFSWFIFAASGYRKKLKETKLLPLFITLITVGLALVIADTQAGGLLQRYFSDFGYIFMIASALAIFALLDSAQTEREHSLVTKFVFISVIFSVFYTCALAFSVSDVTIDIQNPKLFGTLSHIVQFWL